MRREACAPRANWRERCEQAGFGYHSVGGTYWDAADMLVQHIGKKEGGLDKLKGDVSKMRGAADKQLEELKDF